MEIPEHFIPCARGTDVWWGKGQQPMMSPVTRPVKVTSPEVPGCQGLGDSLVSCPSCTNGLASPHLEDVGWGGSVLQCHHTHTHTRAKSALQRAALCSHLYTVLRECTAIRLERARELAGGRTWRTAQGIFAVGLKEKGFCS